MALGGKSVSFADYRAKATGANIDRRSVAELNRELDEVERVLQGGGLPDGS